VNHILKASRSPSESCAEGTSTHKGIDACVYVVSHWDSVGLGTPKYFIPLCKHWQFGFLETFVEQF
jgi:hypothetical protein